MIWGSLFCLIAHLYCSPACLTVPHRQAILGGARSGNHYICPLFGICNHEQYFDWILNPDHDSFRIANPKEQVSLLHIECLSQKAFHVLP